MNKMRIILIAFECDGMHISICINHGALEEYDVRKS